MTKKTIGLFGTCGKSIWRNDFIKEYNSLSISFYNPQVENGMWKPELAYDENFHFFTDEIVIFCITDESPSLGSLAETGFSVLSILHKNIKNRYFIVFIDSNCIDGSSNDIIEESIRVRKLVKSKLEVLKSEFSNLIICNSIDEVKNTSIQLYGYI